jgi:serine/threonine-protein kinase
VLGGLRVFRSGESGASANARTVIAVLPLQNLTTDSAHSFFAGGLHDEILSQLSRIGSLRVISRTSVLGYAGTGTSIREIGSQLGAGSVVEGSVQVIGERLRVIVQLIDASNESHIWSNTYDRTLDDAFAIQSDVAKQIVAAVGAALTATEQRGLAEAPTNDPEAYQLYLQGREYLLRPGLLRSHYEIAQNRLEQAVALDPSFALARASLSVVHGRMYWFRHDPRPTRAAMQLREALEAVRLAPELPEAHYALGLAHYWGRRDYGEALKEFSIAEKSRPNDAELIAAIAFVHRRLGNWAEVVAAFERAAQLSPRDYDLFRDLGGNTFRRLGRFDDAVQAYARASSLAPDVHVAAIERGITYVLWRGQLDTLRALLDLVPRNEELPGLGSRNAHRAQLLLWERKADSLLAIVVAADERVFTGQILFIPTALCGAWAHRIRGDSGAARTAFETARVLLDSAARELPDDWRVTAAHGLALAGLGRREEALRMADKLQQSVVYRDALNGPNVAEERARILAQAGATDAALDAIERLLAEPMPFTVHLLRLDPRWDPIRENARFKLLLTKYARSP